MDSNAPLGPCPEDVEPLSDHSAFPTLCPDALHADNYTFCPWAKSISGLDVNSGKWQLVATTCKRWGCPYCAKQKVKKLAFLTREAAPNKLLTLTVSSHRYPTGEEAWKAMSKAFPEIIRFWRKQTGDCDYLRVLELQDNGYPHFHCLVRARFIVHSQINAEWRRLIGDPEPTADLPSSVAMYDTRWRTPSGQIKQWAGVNLKGIDQTFATFRYLFAYLTSLYKVPWTDRHVSFSKGFFNPELLEEREYPKMQQVTRYDQHPWVWLQERYGWDTVTVLGDRQWELPDEPRDPGRTVRPRELGLPDEPEPTPPAVPTQTALPGLADAQAPGQDDHLDAAGKIKKRKRQPLPKTTDPRTGKDVHQGPPVPF